jgi:hypothetical protein
MRLPPLATVTVWSELEELDVAVAEDVVLLLAVLVVPGEPY